VEPRCARQVRPIGRTRCSNIGMQTCSRVSATVKYGFFQGVTSPVEFPPALSKSVCV